MVSKLLPFSHLPSLFENLSSHTCVIDITGLSKSEWRWVLGTQPNVDGRESFGVVITSIWCLATEEHRAVSHRYTHVCRTCSLSSFLTFHKSTISNKTISKHCRINNLSNSSSLSCCLCILNKVSFIKWKKSFDYYIGFYKCSFQLTFRRLQFKMLWDQF